MKRVKTDMNERQRIMLVNDDQDMARILDRTLKLEGFDTVIVTDSESALALMKKIQPDMVILDEITPGPESIDVVDQIRESSDVPIIMLTQEYEIISASRWGQSLLLPGCAPS
jgi:DNA-binding response OmpR family regulator